MIEYVTEYSNDIFQKCEMLLHSCTGIRHMRLWRFEGYYTFTNILHQVSDGSY